MMSDKFPNDDREKTRPETNGKTFDDIEDDVVGTIKAPANGDKIILDDFIDDDGEGGARILAYSILGSIAVIVGLIIAAIKIGRAHV